MRNALNKLADTVTDPAEKKVSLHCSIFLLDFVCLRPASQDTIG